jgi:hypothetical protein
MSKSPDKKGAQSVKSTLIAAQVAASSSSQFRMGEESLLVDMGVSSCVGSIDRILGAHGLGRRIAKQLPPR